MVMPRSNIYNVVFLDCPFTKSNNVGKYFRRSKLFYSRALSCTASSCMDLEDARFWIGSKNIWDARFLMNCYLRCTDFWFCLKTNWDARFLVIYQISNSNLKWNLMPASSFCCRFGDWNYGFSNALDHIPKMEWLTMSRNLKKECFDM